MKPRSFFPCNLRSLSEEWGLCHAWAHIVLEQKTHAHLSLPVVGAPPSGALLPLGHPVVCQVLQPLQPPADPHREVALQVRLDQEL